VFAFVPLPAQSLVVVLAIGQIGSVGWNALTGATLPSELVPERKGAAIGINNLLAASLGITLSPIIGGLLADRFGLIVPVVLAGLCWVVALPLLLGVPETAPKVLLKRGLVQAATPEGVVPA
jgi:MFS family permease